MMGKYDIVTTLSAHRGLRISSELLLTCVRTCSKPRILNHLAVIAFTFSLTCSYIHIFYYFSFLVFIGAPFFLFLVAVSVFQFVLSSLLLAVSL
jgi:hypothetical protein